MTADYRTARIAQAKADAEVEIAALEEQFSGEAALTVFAKSPGGLIRPIRPIQPIESL